MSALLIHTLLDISPNVDTSSINWFQFFEFEPLRGRDLLSIFWAVFNILQLQKGTISLCVYNEQSSLIFLTVTIVKVLKSIYFIMVLSVKSEWLVTMKYFTLRFFSLGFSIIQVGIFVHLLICNFTCLMLCVCGFWHSVCCYILNIIKLARYIVNKHCFQFC